MPDLEEIMGMKEPPRKKKAKKKPREKKRKKPSRPKPAKKPKAPKRKPGKARPGKQKKPARKPRAPKRKPGKVKPRKPRPREPKKPPRKPRVHKPKPRKVKPRKPRPTKPKPAAPPEAPGPVIEPTTMAEAMKRAKEAYLSAIKEGALKPSPDVPGHIDIHPKKKQEIYQKYKDVHGGRAGTVEKTAVSRMKRIPSGIPGLDTLIQGGYKKYSTVLVTGGPGCGKSTFVLQFLYTGALQGEAGLYISFEESEPDIIDDYSSFNWELQKLEKSGNLFFLHYQPHEVEKIIAQGGGMIKDLIREHKIKRVAIDSLTSFALLFKTEYERRINVLKLFDMLASWDCTVLMTSERTASLEADIGEFGLEFLVDGAILLYNVRKRNIRERALEVLKMRGTNIVRKICPLTISNEGITIFPEAEVFSDI